MKYTNVVLKTADLGIPLSLSNSFPNVFKVTDAIEDAKDSKDLLNRLREMDSYVKTFDLDRETSNYIRYKLVTNMCNNVEYLIIYK